MKLKNNGCKIFSILSIQMLLGSISSLAHADLPMGPPAYNPTTAAAYVQQQQAASIKAAQANVLNQANAIVNNSQMNVVQKNDALRQLQESLKGKPENSYDLQKALIFIREPIATASAKYKAGISTTTASSSGSATVTTRPPTSSTSTSSSGGLGGTTPGYVTDPFSQQTTADVTDPFSATGKSTNPVDNITNFNLDSIINQYTAGSTSSSSSLGGLSFPSDQYYKELAELEKSQPSSSANDAGLASVSLPPSLVVSPVVIGSGGGSGTTGSNTSDSSSATRTTASTTSPGLLSITGTYIADQWDKLVRKSERKVLADVLRGKDSEAIKDDVEALAKAQVENAKNTLITQIEHDAVRKIASSTLGSGYGDKAVKGFDELQFVYTLATQTRGMNRDGYAKMAAGMAAQYLLKYFGSLCPACAVISLALQSILPKLISRMYTKGCDNARYTKTLTCRMGRAETDNIFWEIQKISWKGLKRRCKWGKTVGNIAPASDKDIVDTAEKNSIDVSKYLNLDTLLGDDTMSEDDALDFFKGVDTTKNLAQLYFPSYDPEDASNTNSDDMTNLNESMRRTYLDKEYNLWVNFDQKIISSLSAMKTDFSNVKSKADLQQEAANSESQFKQMDALFAEYLQYKKGYKDLKIVRDSSDKSAGVMRDVEEAFMIGYQQQILARKNLEARRQQL